MAEEKSKKANENFKNLVDCYYLLLKKFKKKSTYLIDEFLIKETKESTGALSIYEDMNIDAFYYLILSMIDSNYNNIKKINILNVQNGNEIIKGLCFYMDHVLVDEILKKNTKSTKKKEVTVKPNNNDKKQINKKGVTTKEKKKEEVPVEVDTRNVCDIKSISVFNSNLNVHGILILSKSLYENAYAKLEHLSIDCNVLTSECIKYLSLSLCNYNNLKSLSFQYCNLHDDCVTYLIDIIIYMNSSLQSINLCGNKITSIGMSRIFESFLLNTSLSTVDVSYNMFTLDQPFVDRLSKFISNNMYISNVVLVGNFIDQENLSRINKAMDQNKTITELKLPLGVDDELIKEINQKLIVKKKKKKKKEKLPTKITLKEEKEMKTNTSEPKDKNQNL